MDEQLQKAGFKMNFLMAVTMSLCLSLVNNGTSGHFSLPLFFITVVLSFIVSMLIGILVPMPRIAMAIIGRFGHGIGSRLLDTLVSDLIYTPFITIMMVFMVRLYVNIVSGGQAQLPPYPVMCLKALLISLAVAYVVIFVVSPIYRKLLFKDISRP